MRHPCASTGKNVVSRVHRGCASFHGHATNTLAFKSFRIIYFNLNLFPNRISSIQTVRSRLSYLIVLHHWKSKLIETDRSISNTISKKIVGRRWRDTQPDRKSRPLGSVSIKRIPILLEPVRRQRLPTYMYTHAMYTMRCDATRQRRTPRRCTPMPVPGNFNN